MVRSLSLSVSSSLFPCPRLLPQKVPGRSGMRWCSASPLHVYWQSFGLLPWQFGTL